MKQRILALLLGAALVAPLFAQGLSTPMATVRLTKTEIISERQFRDDVAKVEKMRGRALNDEERKAFLDDVIDDILFAQLCERDGIKTTDAEVNAMVGQVRSQLGQNVTDAQFEQYLSSQGVALADYRTLIRKQILQQKWLQAAKAADIRAIPPVTPQEVVSNYELLKAQLVQPESARVALVYYPFQADTQAERDKGGQVIRSLQDRLAKGESFDSVRLKAADLSYGASRDLLVPKTAEGMQIMAGFGINREQFDMIFALRDGSNTAPFQTQAGWFIARKFESFPQKQLELSDPVAPGQTVTVQAWLAQQIAGKRQQEFIAKAFSELRAQLRKQAEVRITGRP